MGEFWFDNWINFSSSIGNKIYYKSTLKLICVTLTNKWYMCINLTCHKPFFIAMTRLVWQLCFRDVSFNEEKLQTRKVKKSESAFYDLIQQLIRFKDPLDGKKVSRFVSAITNYSFYGDFCQNHGTRKSDLLIQWHSDTATKPSQNYLKKLTYSARHNQCRIDCDIFVITIPWAGLLSCTVQNIEVGP